MKFKEFCKKYILRFPVIELILLAAMIALDLITKNLVANAANAAFPNNPEWYSVDVIGSFFRIKYARNEGAAWSFLAGKDWGRTFLLCVSGVAIPLFMVYLFFNRKKSLLLRMSLTLIVSGALGNFIDRLFLGYVRDFISFSMFNPIFNLADTWLTVGVALFILHTLLDIIKETKQNRMKERAAAGLPDASDEEQQEVETNNENRV